MKKFVNEMHNYQFTGEVQIEESEDEEEIPTMVIDDDQNSVDEKTEEKMEDVSEALVSYEISDKEEIDTFVK